MRLVHFIFIFFAFLACKNTNSGETPKNTEGEVDSLTLNASLHDIPQTSVDANITSETYYVLVDKLRVRDKPGKKGNVLAQVPEGTAITFLGEQSDFEDRIKLRDQWVEAPWLKIKTNKAVEGWVFGGAVAAELPETYISKTPFDECEAAFVAHRDEEILAQCISEKEEQELKKVSRYVKAHGNGYTITLLSGETVNLEHNLLKSPEDGSAEDYRKYQFRYYLDKMGYFVFQVDSHESTDFLLMDDKYGFVNLYAGLPRMSPDRRKILVVSFEPVDSFGNYGIQMVRRGEQTIDVVFEEEITGFIPANPRWLDAKNVEFDFLSLPDEDKQWKVKAKLTEVEPDNWVLNISNRRE